MSSPQWYLVQGRQWGDDDDSCIPYFTATADDAVQAFREAMGCTPTQNDDGDDRSWGCIVSVWACGAVKPHQVR